MKDWKADLMAREPQGPSAGDCTDAFPPVAMEDWVRLYESAAKNWCREAHMQYHRANRWRTITLAIISMNAVLAWCLWWLLR